MDKDTAWAVEQLEDHTQQQGWLAHIRSHGLLTFDIGDTFPLTQEIADLVNRDVNQNFKVDSFWVEWDMPVPKAMVKVRLSEPITIEGRQAWVYLKLPVSVVQKAVKP